MAAPAPPLPRLSARRRACACSGHEDEAHRHVSADQYYAKNIRWPNSGVGLEYIDLTGWDDAFTFTTKQQLEDYGLCKKGEGGHYVSDGTIMLGGNLCERATPTASA
jgi:acetyl-CoA acetyltransferase